MLSDHLSVTYLLGDTDNLGAFTVILGMTGVDGCCVDIDTATSHSIAATFEGEVYTWIEGWVLNQRDTRHSAFFYTKVKGVGLGVVLVAGFMHSMALMAGDLYTWRGLVKMGD